MDLKSCAEQYGISQELLHQFIDTGIIADITLQDTLDVELDEEMNKLSSCICLHSIGLDVATLKEYMRLKQSDEHRDTRISMLCDAREIALHRMHEAFDVLECIDCIIKELKSTL